MHISLTTRIRVAQERRAQDYVLWCVTKDSVIPASCHWAHLHVLFHLPHLSSSLSPLQSSPGTGSTYLRRSTAEWRIHWNPISHTTKGVRWPQEWDAPAMIMPRCASHLPREHKTSSQGGVPGRCFFCVALTCEHHTQPTRISTRIDTSAHVISSCDSRASLRKTTWSVVSLTKKISSSCLAQHVARVFPAVSITDEHNLTFHSFHLHSSPTFYTTINQTPIDVIFTQRLYLRRFIECVLRSCAGIDIPTGYEVKNLIEGNSVEIKPMFFYKPSMTSTCDASESICDTSSWIGFGRWSSSAYDGFNAVPTGERSKCWPTTSLSLFPRKLSVQVESRHIFRQRRHITRTPNRSLFRFSDPEEAARTVLEEQRDHQLAEAKSEILKQMCKVDALDVCVREFHRQAHSNRVELDSENCGYEESRREQAQLHEELAQRGEALRDTRIRNIHEVEELKRAQELLIDEFPVHKLRESPETIHKGSLHKYKKYKKGWIIWLTLISDVPSQPAVIPSPRSMLSCDNACNLKHEIHLDYRKTFLQRNSSICGTKCCRWGSRANQHRETCG